MSPRLCFPIFEFWLYWLALLNLYDLIMVYSGLRRETATFQLLTSTRAVQCSAGSSTLKKALSFEAMIWLCEDILLRSSKMIFLLSGSS